MKARSPKSNGASSRISLITMSIMRFTRSGMFFGDDRHHEPGLDRGIEHLLRIALSALLRACCDSRWPPQDRPGGTRRNRATRSRPSRAGSGNWRSLGSVCITPKSNNSRATSRISRAKTSSAALGRFLPQFLDRDTVLEAHGKDRSARQAFVQARDDKALDPPPAVPRYSASVRPRAGNRLPSWSCCFGRGHQLFHFQFGRGETGNFQQRDDIVDIAVDAFWRRRDIAP